MSMTRTCVFQQGQERMARTGDGYFAAPKVTVDATAGARTITAEAIRGGVAQFTGAAGAVTYTTPTGTQLAAVFYDMDVGESVTFKLSNTAAQVATVAGGTGVTASGNLTANAGVREFVLVRTAAATFDLIGL